MSETHPTIDLETISVRDWTADDQDAVRWHYEHGRLGGEELPNDTAADVDNIHEAYIAPERANFWVADHHGEIVGMVGVAEEEPHLAEIRRLRVHPDKQGHGIGIKLMETALHFCRHHDYLKVVLDTNYSGSKTAMAIFDKCAFQHNRTRTVGGKELIEFYLDLYRDSQSDD